MRFYDYFICFLCVLCDIEYIFLLLFIFGNEIVEEKRCGFFWVI